MSNRLAFQNNDFLFLHKGQDNRGVLVVDKNYGAQLFSTAYEYITPGNHTLNLGNAKTLIAQIYGAGGGGGNFTVLHGPAKNPAYCYGGGGGGLTGITVGDNAFAFNQGIAGATQIIPKQAAVTEISAPCGSGAGGLQGGKGLYYRATEVLSYPEGAVASNYTLIGFESAQITQRPTGGSVGGGNGRYRGTVSYSNTYANNFYSTASEGAYAILQWKIPENLQNSDLTITVGAGGSGGTNSVTSDSSSTRSGLPGANGKIIIYLGE